VFTPRLHFFRRKEVVSIESIVSKLGRSFLERVSSVLSQEKDGLGSVPSWVRFQASIERR